MWKKRGYREVKSFSGGAVCDAGCFFFACHDKEDSPEAKLPSKCSPAKFALTRTNFATARIPPTHGALEK